MKYVYKIIDDHYYEMGGEPYEYGEYELASFGANEVKPLLFEKVVSVVRDQTDKKEWQYLAKRLRCRIHRGEDLIATYHIDHDGRITGDDGGGWAEAMDDGPMSKDADSKMAPPKSTQPLKSSRSSKPSATEIEAARKRLTAPQIVKTEKRSSHGGKKRTASKRSDNNNSSRARRR